MAALFVGLGAVLVPPAEAQDAAPFHRDRLGFPVGLVKVSAGDDRCSDPRGLAVGVEARTRGRLMLAARGELMGGFVMECITPGKIERYQGRDVEVFTKAGLPLAPRLSVRAGPSFAMGDLGVEIGAGVGLLYLTCCYEERSFYSTWYGAFLTLRAAGAPLAVELEYGSREVPHQYVFDREVVHQFGRHARLWTFGLSF